MCLIYKVFYLVYKFILDILFTTFLFIMQFKNFKVACIMSSIKLVMIYISIYYII